MIAIFRTWSENHHFARFTGDFSYGLGQYFQPWLALAPAATVHQGVSARQRHRHDHDESGIDAKDAPPVELPERERPGIDLAQDDPGDQKAADNEENVDPDEATGKLPGSHKLLI